MALKHKFKWLSDLISGANWNEDHELDATGLDFPIGPAPAPPALGNARLHGRSVGGRAMAAVTGPLGMTTSLQPFFGRNKVSMVSYAGNNAVAAGISTFSMASPSTNGTQTARTVATTNLLSSMKRMGYVSTATAASRAGISGVAQYHRGAAPQMGGFFAVFRFGCSDAATVAGARTMVGLVSNGAAITLEPTSATNCVFVGTGSADATFSIFHNDGTGTATKIPLGTDFPDHTLGTDVYELALFCAPNGTQIEWEVTRLNRPDIAPATGVITTKLPVNTVLMFPYVQRTNNETLLSVGMDIVGLYFETDY